MLLILTVGTGTQGRYSNLAQGLINTILLTKPDHFWLIPSESPDSIAVAELILDGLEVGPRGAFVDWRHGCQRFAAVPNHDSLEEARHRTSEVIAKARDQFPGVPIHVNPTSGTKQMSAGATLAALDLGVDGITFTTGQRADGVVITGTEEVTPFDAARWRAEKDADLAAKLWNLNHFAAAAEALQSAARHLHSNDAFRQRLLALAILADAFGSKESFQFTAAAQRFKEARRELRPDDAPDGSPIKTLGTIANQRRRDCEKLAKAQGGQKNLEDQRFLLAEIVANAKRAANAGRHDDASCRIYRAMEMNLQIRLAEKTDCTYWNGRLVNGKTPPSELKDSVFLHEINRPSLPKDFSMEHLARALRRLGDQAILPLCEDLDLDKKSRFRGATETRNASILAHGVRQVDQAGFDGLVAIASEFLGISITQVPAAPPFDLAWLSTSPP